MPLTDAEDRRLRTYTAEIRRRQSYPFACYLPDTGPLRRELYAKHVEMFRAGATFKERLFMAANRVGKSMAGAYEVACHLTGLYPPWWEGRRFATPVEVWACGTTSETLRDIVQVKLFGAWDGVISGTLDGTGMVPAHLVEHWVRRPHGLPGSIESAWVKHVTGGRSMIGLKMYEQGRKSFEGTEKHIVWCLAEGQPVQMADGSLRPIESVAAGDIVLSLDCDGRAVPRRVLGVVDQGVKPCVRVQPKHGTPVVCTPDHAIYWGYNRDSKQRADKVEDIAQIRPGWWPKPTTDRDDAWYVWAALVVAEGYIAGRKVTCGDVPSLQRAAALLPAHAHVRMQTFHQSDHVPDWHLVWPEFWSEWFSVGAERKQIPSWVFTSSREKAALFLRWLYMGDGWATDHWVGYATTSPRLAEELTILLNRFGVRAALRERQSAHQNWRTQYWVTITKAADVLTFLNEIGIEGKEGAVSRVRAEAERRVRSNLARGQQLVVHGRRQYAARVLATRLKSSRVVGIADAGEQRVYDITVENEHRFLCGTSLVSNCDEEPPEDCYTEMLYRTATTKGITIITFTPLQGMSAVVKGFLQPEQEEARAVKTMIQAGWNDVPHLDAAEKAALLATTPPFQRDARSTGTPQLGAGAIYAVPESEIRVADFPIPAHWRRGFGLDAGGGRKATAAVWGALNPDTSTLYVYDAYKRESPEIAIHLDAIKARGAWIPGVGDAAALVTTQHDAEQIIRAYQRGGLDLELPDKAVESGILDVWMLMTAGLFKVFASCTAWWDEFKLYHRDEQGRIVKEHDHLLDATRYLVRSGVKRMKTQPAPKRAASTDDGPTPSPQQWMS